MAPTIDSASSVRAGDRLFFQASNGLWITNGSPQGTVLLRQFSSSPNAFMVHNSVVYFVAATEAGSMALWSSDGTVSGTKMVSDVNSGSPNSWFWVTSIVNGRAILANNSGPTKVLLSVALIGGAVTTLHTATTTCEYGSFYGESAVAGSTLYVVFNEHDANCVLTNQSILSTDGTTTSTRVAVDLVPNSEIENYNYLSALGTSLIFRANNGTSGDELWSFNGTSTVLLKDINVGSGGSNPLPLFTLGSALFFSAQDASGATAIYRTDGTSNGTALFRSFPAGGNNDWVDIQHFKASSTLAYVAARRSGSAPFGEFWRTDGTTANTVALTPWPVEASASLWNAVTDTSGNFYFPGFTTAHGQELFRISGTTISLVADIAPGAGSFSPTSLALGLDGRVYFSSTNNGSGSQNGGDLWSTNGTASGTRRVLGRVLEDGLGIQDRIIPLPGGLVFKAKRPDMGTERVLLTYRPGILNTFPSEGMTAVLPLSAPLIAPGGMLTLVP
jgi:ELWxxDGT repeat protein